MSNYEGMRNPVDPAPLAREAGFTALSDADNLLAYAIYRSPTGQVDDMPEPKEQAAETALQAVI